MSDFFIFSLLRLVSAITPSVKHINVIRSHSCSQIILRTHVSIEYYVNRSMAAYIIIQSICALNKSYSFYLSIKRTLKYT